MPIIECRSAAKVNLTLDILGRRDDGYHLLQSLVHTLNWWDELRFRDRDDGEVTLSCSQSALENADNLCVRAARLYLKTLRARGKTRRCGADISLTKNIPSGAGLGGGSGNAAATLLAMNELHARVLAPHELEKLALQLGADVPLFLRGGCVLMEGIGEKLRDLPPLSGCLLLAQPMQPLDTAEVYARFDEQFSSSRHATQVALQALRDAARPVASTRETPIGGAGQSRLSVLSLANSLGNDLEGAAQDCGVAVESIKGELRDGGARAAAMSGSGSCVFGLFETEPAAQAARARLQHRGEFAVLQVASLNACGVEIGM